MVSTLAQTVAKTVAPTTSEPLDNLHARHSGTANQIGQAQLPLSFGLADAATAGRCYVLAPTCNGEAISKDLVHTLAYKVLQMPIFSSVELMTRDFKPTRIFHLVGKMLEGQMAMPSLKVA